MMKMMKMKKNNDDNTNNINKNLDENNHDNNNNNNVEGNINHPNNIDSSSNEQQIRRSDVRIVRGTKENQPITQIQHNSNSIILQPNENKLEDNVPITEVLNA